jgi:hypothetical protein
LGAIQIVNALAATSIALTRTAAKRVELLEAGILRKKIAASSGIEERAVTRRGLERISIFRSLDFRRLAFGEGFAIVVGWTTRRRAWIASKGASSASKTGSV